MQTDGGRRMKANGNRQYAGDGALPAVLASEPGGRVVEVLAAPDGAAERAPLRFRALVFRAAYPNAKYVRFREEDLAGLAASFAGAPFLRDHNTREIAARGGTVVEGNAITGADGVAGVEVVVEVVRPRDVKDVKAGLIDRFSIGFDYRGLTCGVCDEGWLTGKCQHWPGETYRGKVCELIVEQPRGVEVSGVNVPAVAGTRIVARLARDGGGGFETRPYEGEKVDEEREQEQGGAATGRAEDDGSAVLVAAFRESVLETRLAASGLSVGLQRLVRESLPAAWSVADLDAGIVRVRTAFAEQEQRQTVRGVVGVSGMIEPAEKIGEALSALIEGRNPERGVRPLSGLREAYLLLSGDYEMTGRFREERVELANVNSTTMANIVANVLNKLVVSEFQSYPRWWEPFTRRESFNSLQTVKWVTLGGIGELPVVAEGGAYTELSWDDSAETASWQKRGGYLGLTIEAVDKDDVGKLRHAPRALASAAWLTLGKSVAAVFTANSGAGPTLADTGALFNATAVSSAGGHANLGTTALGTASWAAAKLAMRKQAELNSGERLGALTTPKFLLVPSDLEATALTVLASENMPGGANNDVNPEAEGNSHDARLAAARRRVIVVDLWTDVTDWAAVADPRLYPTIGIGFRYGEAPEVFSVASPTSGLMFTNDVMPVKVRWFSAVGPMDFRGLYKANVAG
jgi:hypothetical protein